MTQHPPHILNQHEVDSAVVACIDFRFRGHLPEAIRKAFGVEHWDQIKLAGGAKNISMPGKKARMETVLDDIGLAISAHNAKTIILLNHQNCGKYAAEGHVFADPGAERTFHGQELRRAGGIVENAFPKANVRLGYVFVNSEGIVEIEPVKP